LRGDGVSDAGRRRSWQVEPAHDIDLYGEELAVHEFREWGGKQDCGIERFQQDILADR
jgi:hypothetical protein